MMGIITILAKSGMPSRTVKKNWRDSFLYKCIISKTEIKTADCKKKTNKSNKIQNQNKNQLKPELWPGLSFVPNATQNV